MRKALVSMGYRQAKPSIWAKPVGYSMFTFNADTKCWYHLFKGAEKVLCWQSDKYESQDWNDDLLPFLRHMEAQQSTYHGDGQFEFFTLADILDF